MNIIKLPVSELKSALTGLGKIIARKVTLPVLTHLRVSRDQKGFVQLQSTDLDTFITYHAQDVQSGPVVDVLLPVNELSNAVKSSSAKETISLVVEPKAQVKLRYLLGGSPVERELETLEVKEWPPVPEINQPGTVLDKEFGPALKEALQCCSEDSSRYILHGAYLDVNDKKLHYIVSTNGRMLYSANSFCFDLQKSIIIPDSKFITATDFLDDEGGLLSVGNGKDVSWVKMQTPRWTFVTKQIEGNYPNWKQVVPKSKDDVTKILLNEAALKQVQAVAPRLPADDEQNRPVRIRFDAQSVFIEGRGKDQKDWTSICVQEAVAKGRHVSVSLNREYLLKAMRFGLKMMEIDDELSPVVFWNGGKKMVVMPLNPNATPATASATPAPAKPEDKADTNPQPKPETPETNERKTMPRTTSRIQTPVNGETQQTSNGTHNGSENGSAMKTLADKVDQIRETLKNVVRDLGDSKARKLITALHQAAHDLPFKQLGEIVDLSGDECNFEMRDNEDPLRWLLCQAQGTVKLKRTHQSENGEWGDSWISVVPTRVIAFDALPGEGCEQSNFGLCQFPSEVFSSNVGTVKTRLSGWRWRSSCKTQYASDPAYGGVPNFLQCHLTVIALLDKAKVLGCLHEVADEGHFWEGRDIEALIKEIGSWNEMIAAFAGQLKDLTNGTKFNIETPIIEFPNFERLEAAGQTKLPIGMNKLAELISQVVKAGKGPV